MGGYRLFQRCVEPNTTVRGPTPKAPHIGTCVEDGPRSREACTSLRLIKTSTEWCFDAWQVTIYWNRSSCRRSESMDLRAVSSDLEARISSGKAWFQRAAATELPGP